MDKKVYILPAHKTYLSNDLTVSIVLTSTILPRRFINLLSWLQVGVEKPQEDNKTPTKSAKKVFNLYGWACKTYLLILFISSKQTDGPPVKKIKLEKNGAGKKEESGDEEEDENESEEEEGENLFFIFLL